MIEWMLYIGLISIGLAIVITVYRIVVGPSLPDRIIALDMIGVQIVAAVAIVSVIRNTTVFLEVILIIAILAFISTIAFSKSIERGVIIDRKRDD
jgi:multicomponent Na+:H+ antiporter subunit F